MNYLLPKRGILSMHASANEGKDRIQTKKYAVKNPMNALKYAKHRYSILQMAIQ